jgi:HK97 family phage major capsid protein
MKEEAQRGLDRRQKERSMEDMRPYPNEHAARLKDPAQYDSFARVNDEGGDGIDFIYGVKDGATELQAIRFDKTKFSPAEARDWLAKHDFSPIEFEEASEREVGEIQATTLELQQSEDLTMDEIQEERKTESKFTRSEFADVTVQDERRIAMSISSETPVARSFGDEILVHSSEAIDLSFLNSGRAPLLLDHDPEKQIGVIESVSLDAEARKLRANVRFGKSALASEVYGDVADNIRGNVSIGYSINKMMKSADGRSFRATSWRPMEASIVSIPADVTVGVGRSMEEIASEAEVETPDVVITETVDEQQASEPQITETPAEEVTQEVQPEATERKIEMSNDVNVAVASGAFDAPVQQAADIGMSRKEEKTYSLLRAINALANPSDRAAQRAAAFELECSEAAQRAYGQSAQGILVPAEVLRSWGQRDLNTSDDAALIPQNYRPGDFIDALRNASSVMQAGATMLTGLSGTVKIPKKTAASSAGWFTEGSPASESEMTVGSITMAPKTAGAFTDISRNMMMGANPSIEALVRQDLADSIATALDLGALAGSGSSGQPTGIKNTSGINTPTNFAAATPTWAEVVAMETAVAEDNALRGNLAYILPASMYGALKTTAKATNQAIFVVEPDGMVNGYKAIVSNQVTAGDLYFGNFADLLIGMFGGLDILVDPYTGGTAGTVRVIAMQSIDVAVRHAVSFAFNNDGA